MTAFALRPYQTAAVEAIVTGVKRGVRRGLVVLPTGGGKTLVFAHLVALARRKRSLILAHREELVFQAAEKLAAVNPGRTVAVEMAGEQAGDADIVVASVQSLRTRLDRFNPPEFGLVICDEAHHSTAQSYAQVFEHFGCGTPGGAVLVGFTATPNRSDGEGLDFAFDEVLFELSMRALMSPDPHDPGSPYLARVRAYRVETGTDLREVHTRQGDFAPGELANAVNNVQRNGTIVGAYQEKAAGLRALAFCADVAHAEDLAGAFNAAGIPAGCITGKTPKETRHGLLKAYLAGTVRVLTSCLVLTEGTDLPATACLLMARPTKSALLYTQMLGRGLRKVDGKPFCTVIDFADVTRNAIPSVTTLMGLPPGWVTDGGDPLADAEALERIVEQCPAARHATSLADARYRLREVNLFEDPAEREMLDALSALHWTIMPNESYRLGVRDRAIVRVTQNLLGHFAFTADEEGRNVNQGAYPTLPEAIAAADAYFRQEHADLMRLVHRKASWRLTPPSEKQQAILQKAGLWRPALTKGEASALLERYFERQQAAPKARGGSP